MTRCVPAQITQMLRPLNLRFFKTFRNGQRPLGPPKPCSEAFQGFPNMPFVKCLSGLAEVPYQVPPTFVSQGSYCEVPPKVCRGTIPGTAPLPPKNALKTYLVPGWMEGTFECKARLENAEHFLENPSLRTHEEYHETCF